MGLFSFKRNSQSKSSSSSSKKGKAITNSENHEHAQVVNFGKSGNDGVKGAELGRELFSFPKPEEKETMTDYIQSHKAGDIFPYLAITGKEEESKDNRLARLRSFVSPYGKAVVPETRINGVILDVLQGSLHVSDLKEHTDSTKLSSAQKKQNRRFKDLEPHNFNKPYLQIRRITGEFVPLLSGTSDYTDLVFSLYDERLLEHQVIVQSNKMPTNSSGIFELSCDYCIPITDLRQLSLRYELARPIMREGFQWGTVSLAISLCESDTPHLTPKVEAMAIVRAPYTSMEPQLVDPDHKDVTYTAAQIAKFREMYMQGDVADNDEPKKERSKVSSYSKSSMRGVTKAIKGPEHLGDLEGWSQLKGLKKPLLEDGVASVSAESGDTESVNVPVATKEQWEKEQEELRKMFPTPVQDRALVKHSSSKKPDLERLNSISSVESFRPASADTESDESEPEIMKKMKTRYI